MKTVFRGFLSYVTNNFVCKEMVLLATHSLLINMIPNAVSYELTTKWKKILLKLRSNKENQKIFFLKIVFRFSVS